MTNIAIANFSPREVFNSSWPRFTGFKIVGKPVLESGLFGLVDGDTRMHAFFKNTTIKDVMLNELNYSKETRVVSVAKSITYDDKGVGKIELHPAKPQDTSVHWLPPYTYIDDKGVEWEVYVLITGNDIHISGTFNKVIKSDGYWDMGIWRPKVEDSAWDDIKRIEQLTINHVVSHGFDAQQSLTMFKDDPRYGKYETVNVVREVPPRS